MSSMVDRVRKLIALAASPNEHESRTAAAMACRLIREHGLAVVDPSPHARRADRVAEPRRRHTRGPYTRTRSTRAGVECRECAESIAVDDAFLDADGAPVHGDCIPRDERP